MRKTSKKSNLKKLHLGSGTVSPSGWINIDSSWNAWLAKYPFLQKIIKITGLLDPDILNKSWSKNILIHDLTKSLPFDNDSIDCIYSSHTLEHLYLEDAKKLLKECYRVLKEGGIIRTVVPDLKSYVNQYISGRGTKKNDSWHTKVDRFLDQTNLRPYASNSGSLIFRIYNQLNDTSSHKWMYDRESLTFYLKMTGFKKIKMMGFGKSKITNIKAVEQKVRFEDGFCLEAEK